ncbi:hypothetical protein TNCV_2602081 [Trichonephila clavipes]|nr:hypothetical protein TNCV_2602081 [Trichonephila clavipes]
MAMPSIGDTGNQRTGSAAVDAQPPRRPPVTPNTGQCVENVITLRIYQLRSEEIVFQQEGAPYDWIVRNYLYRAFRTLGLVGTREECRLPQFDSSFIDTSLPGDL